MAKRSKKASQEPQDLTDEDIDEFLHTPIYSLDGKKISFSPQFAKDLKKMVKSKKDLERFKKAIQKADFSKGKPVFPY